MPVEFAAYAFQKTTWLQSLPTWPTILSLCLVACTALLYRFTHGGKCPHACDMHGKVLLLTGGTSGIGAAVAEDLASRGAQLVLLVRRVNDGWTQEYVTSMRRRTGNDLIYAEECDLEDLSSIRTFATAWINTTPARRLDQVILCAGHTQPMYAARRTTADGVEVQFGVNYLANHALLACLAPALRAQPAERDVRVIATTCTAYILAAVALSDLEFTQRGYPAAAPWQAFGAAKLYLMCCLTHLQTRIDAVERADKQPSRVKCLLVDPGLARTLSFRRFVTFGSVGGLLLYLITYPFWILLFKSAQDAAQGVLFASMAPSADVYDVGVKGGELYQDFVAKSARRPEVMDPDFREKLWTSTEAMMKEVETRSAIARKARQKKDVKQ